MVASALGAGLLATLIGASTALAAPSPPLASAPGPAGGGVCSPAEVRASSTKLARALARVEAPGSRGLGIAIDESGHLLTALSIVEVGRGVKVQLSGEESWRDASVVATDEEHGVAIVRVEGVAPSVFAPIAQEDAALGDAVSALTVATEHRGLEFEHDLVLEPGRVSAADNGRLRATSLAGEHHRIGSPLVDCDGQVVGVGTERDGDVAAPTGALRALVGSAATQEPYEGGWTFHNPSIAFSAQLGHRWADGFEEPDRWFGARFGGAIIGHDQWYFPLRVGLYALAGPEPDSKLGDRSGVRVQGEAGFGYRAMLKGGAIPVYLIPQITAVASWERTVLEGTEFSMSLSECAGDGVCPVRATPTEVQEELFRVMPAAGVALGFGKGELGYQLQIDLEEINRSVHQITAGVQF